MPSALPALHSAGMETESALACLHRGWEQWHAGASVEDVRKVWERGAKQAREAGDAPAALRLLTSLGRLTCSTGDTIASLGQLREALQAAAWEWGAGTMGEADGCSLPDSDDASAWLEAARLFVAVARMSSSTEEREAVDFCAGLEDSLTRMGLLLPQPVETPHSEEEPSVGASSSFPPSSGDPPLEPPAARAASGCITVDDFEAVREALPVECQQPPQGMTPIRLTPVSGGWAPRQ
jgi:hypothetical protein